MYFVLFSSVVVLSIGLADFGFSIYHRIHTDESGPGSIGYAAHIGGGAAGILVGINVLRNYIHKVHIMILGQEFMKSNESISRNFC